MNHFARVLALVLVILFVYAAGLTACAPANVAMLASTPEPTPTATPSPTPTPTPTPVPTPTPMPELTYEQKKALLGIDERFKPHKIDSLVLMEISFDNMKEGRIWCVMYWQDNNSSNLDFHSAINDEYLFTLKIKKPVVSSIEMVKQLSNSNENLKNLKILTYCALSDISFVYRNLKISYNNCKK